MPYPLLAAAAPYLMTAATTAASYYGSSQQNKGNIKSAREAMAFEATEAQKNRNFQKLNFDAANAFSSDEAQINRDWQTQLSNTAHQREVEDLKASGLNPILSSKYGGNSTPSGGSAHSASAPGGSMASGRQAHIENKLAPAIHSALDTRYKLAMVKQVEADTNLKNEQSTTQYSVRGEISAQVDRIIQEVKTLESQASLNEIHTAQAKIDILIKEKVTLANGLIDVKKAEMMLEQLQMEMEVYRGPLGLWLKQSEVASRSNTAKSMGAIASKSGVESIQKAIDGLKSLINGAKRNIQPFSDQAIGNKVMQGSKWIKDKLIFGKYYGKNKYPGGTKRGSR